MKSISFKALGIGIGAAVLLSVLFSVLDGVLLLHVWDRNAAGVNFANEVETKEFIWRAALDPLSIFFSVVSIIIAVGTPSYLAAYIARRNFILHSVLIGVFVSLLCLTDWSVVTGAPFLILSIIVCVLAVASTAGLLRKKQVLSNAHAQ